MRRDRTSAIQGQSSLSCSRLHSSSQGYGREQDMNKEGPPNSENARRKSSGANDDLSMCSKRQVDVRKVNQEVKRKPGIQHLQGNETKSHRANQSKTQVCSVCLCAADQGASSSVAPNVWHLK